MTRRMNTVQQVFKAFGTIKEMLNDRQLQDISLHLNDYPFEVVQQLVTTRSVFSLDVDGSLRIIFHMGKFKTADIKRLLEEKFPLYIIVTREKISSVNIKQLAEMDKQIDTFELAELLFNVSHHSLVPKHEAIRDVSKIKEVLDMYRLKNRHQLPLILKSDPMARYLGLRPGQLMRITRVSPGAGEYTLFRCCV